MSDQDTTKINRYLLGQLSKEDVDRIEARLLSETGLFDLAESVEDEIIDRYVRGELAPEERRRFERRLLTSERIAERVAFARAQAAHGGQRDTVSAPVAAPLPAPARRQAIVVPLFRPAAARLAWAATVTMTVLGGWLALQVVRLDDRAEDLEASRAAALERAEEARTQAREAESAVERARRHEAEAAEIGRELAEARARVAELEREELPTDKGRTERRVRRPGDYGDATATESLFLALVTRSGEAEPVLRLEGKEWAELELDLGGQTLPESVTATVTCDGRRILRQEGLKVRSLGGESAAVLVLPAEGLAPGRCGIELRATGSDRLLGTYELSVER